MNITMLIISIFLFLNSCLGFYNNYNPKKRKILLLQLTCVIVILIYVFNVVLFILIFANKAEKELFKHFNLIFYLCSVFCFINHVFVIIMNIMMHKFYREYDRRLFRESLIGQIFKGTYKPGNEKMNEK